ncbi:MAG: DUF3299 domain-containing protein [Holophaga sp.]|nr:DUF3299 domain-containing protein [Holophaga sp.]
MGHEPSTARTASPGCLSTSFKVLAGFNLPQAFFKAKPGHVLENIPASIRGMDGKEVSVTGFMLPIQIKDKLVTQFMLMRTQNTCCFGIPPELHEVVEVLKVKTPAKVLMDIPVTVVGRLHVKDRWEGDFLCSIYQMDAESVTAN